MDAEILAYNAKSEPQKPTTSQLGQQPQELATREFELQPEGSMIKWTTPDDEVYLVETVQGRIPRNRRLRIHFTNKGRSATPLKELHHKMTNRAKFLSLIGLYETALLVVFATLLGSTYKNEAPGSVSNNCTLIDITSPCASMFNRKRSMQLKCGVYIFFLDCMITYVYASVESLMCKWKNNGTDEGYDEDSSGYFCRGFSMTHIGICTSIGAAVAYAPTIIREFFNNYKNDEKQTIRLLHHVYD